MGVFGDLGVHLRWWEKRQERPAIRLPESTEVKAWAYPPWYYSTRPGMTRRNPWNYFKYSM